MNHYNCVLCKMSNKTIFFCPFCEYCTERIDNMLRHVKTIKHEFNFTKNPTKILSDEEKDEILRKTISERIKREINNQTCN